MLPLVSVIIPTCLRPELLRGAIQSVLVQQCQDFEVIVVDDDPLMSAKPVALSFQDARVIYLAHDRRKGGSAARNTGLARSRGRFMAFLDDDDVWHADFLSKMLAAMEKAPLDVGVVSCAVDLVDAQGVRRRSKASLHQRGDIFQAMLRGERSIVGTVALVRREVFEACGGFDEALPSAQDWDMWIRASKRFAFEYLPESLVDVRDHGERISSDPLRPIISRTFILNKYADDFSRDPEARAILIKRLIKLNSLVGRWGEAWRWSKELTRQQPSEGLKIAAWMIFERPWAVAPGEDRAAPFYAFGALLLSIILTAYSQLAALRSAYVVNDDVCQHIWWMRLWHTPGLFKDDLLAQYAQSLQHGGILALYWTLSWLADPLTVVRYLPFILFPLASLLLFRWVLALTRSAYVSFVTTLAFMVTPIYMQHMTGGHAHAFAYPLLILFLYAFTTEKYRLAMASLVLAVLFFPIVFLLGIGFWTYSFCRKKEHGFIWQGTVLGERMLVFALLAGTLILAVRFLSGADPMIGSVLAVDALKRMPEVTSLGRWEVWPVMPVWQAMMQFLEKGIFIYQAGYKIGLSEAWKAFLLTGHMLWLIVTLVTGMWWWRRRKEAAFRALGILVAVSVLFYVLAAMFLLKLYAPDRYVAYTLTLVGLVMVMVPAGTVVASWPHAFVRRVMKVVLVFLVLAWVPLIKGAGLKDYGAQKKLYAFLATLPQDSLIAAYPDTADGIPLFSRRKVFINEELSVPLFDRYWDTVRGRTYDLLSAYYAADKSVVDSFIRRNGITHIVIEQGRFSPAFLSGRIYFEPFGSWAKVHVDAGKDFWLRDQGAGHCMFKDKDVCVVDARFIMSGAGGSDGQ
jgi:glycosyltransferase involved in cell wall biosynthesis